MARKTSKSDRSDTRLTAAQSGGQENTERSVILSDVEKARGQVVTLGLELEAALKRCIEDSVPSPVAELVPSWLSSTADIPIGTTIGSLIRQLRWRTAGRPQLRRALEEARIKRNRVIHPTEPSDLSDNPMAGLDIIYLCNDACKALSRAVRLLQWSDPSSPRYPTRNPPRGSDRSRRSTAQSLPLWR